MQPALAAAEAARDEAAARAIRLEREVEAARQHTTKLEADLAAARAADLTPALREAEGTRDRSMARIAELEAALERATAQSVPTDQDLAALTAARADTDAARESARMLQEELAALREATATGTQAREAEMLAELTALEETCQSAFDERDAALDQLRILEQELEAVRAARAQEPTSPAAAAAPQSERRPIDVSLMMNVGSPVPLRAKSATAPAPERPATPDKLAASHTSSAVPLRAKGADLSVPVETTPPPLPAAATDRPANGIKNRKDKRVATQTPATLWREGLREPMSCIIRDKSASGALIEVPQSRFGQHMSDLGVGDRYTLTISLSRETSTVLCEVMRVEGRNCGIRFCGPFHTQMVKSRKPVKQAGR
jgi:hypothetical protein